MTREERIKVSFIIPCFNAEKTILQTLSSLNECGINNCEIICIDDGSTDNTKSIILDFQNSNKNYIVYEYQQNKGVSAARNSGIRLSRGELLFFVDADDLLSKNFIESSIDCYDKGYDCLMGKFTRECPDLLSAKGDVHELKKINCMSKFMVEKDKYHTSALFYVKRILAENNIYFTDGARYGEDWEFTTKYLDCCNKFCEFDNFAMYYRKSTNSAMTKVSVNMTDAIDAAFRTSLFLKERSSDFYFDFDNYMIPKSVFATLHTFSKAKKLELFKNVQDKYDARKYMKQLFFNKNADFATRGGALSYLINWRLFYFFIGRF